ncbi:MAG TPA: germination protein YpeB, partial [Bacillota bacterium]|nr:germination protein YpeB [Bacillota bacterium]
MQRLTYVVLGILILALAFFSYNQYSARQTAEVGLSNQYARAFFELTSSVNSATANLGKVLVSKSDVQTAQSLAQITRDAFNAQAYLTNMPLPQSMLVRTSEFLNQLGDYSLSLSRATAGSALTDENRKMLEELFENARSLSNQLEEI